MCASQPLQDHKMLIFHFHYWSYIFHENFNCKTNYLQHNPHEHLGHITISPMNKASTILDIRPVFKVSILILVWWTFSTLHIMLKSRPKIIIEPWGSIPSSQHCNYCCSPSSYQCWLLTLPKPNIIRFSVHPLYWRSRIEVAHSLTKFQKSKSINIYCFAHIEKIDFLMAFCTHCHVWLVILHGHPDKTLWNILMMSSPLKLQPMLLNKQYNYGIAKNMVFIVHCIKLLT